MKKELYADVILPLAVKGKFTYRIPDNLSNEISVGSIVLIKFGNKKFYSGVVSNISDKSPEIEKIKDISDVLGNAPVVNQIQLKFWNWLSEYYMCSIGEVMKAAMSSGSTLAERYKPKEERFIILSRKYSDSELNIILDKLAAAPKQHEILTTYLSLTGYSTGSDLYPVKNSLLLKESRALQSSVISLIRKGILVSLDLEVSRLSQEEINTEPLNQLSEGQSEAFNSLVAQLEEKEIVLLHGVTSSGKTELYIRLIEEQILKGKQVLYLLPEIALTTQIIFRLKRHFGKLTTVFHSRLADNERMEI